MPTAAGRFYPASLVSGSTSATLGKYILSMANSLQGWRNLTTSPHFALAVSDIVEAKAELESKGMEYYLITGIYGPQGVQLFLLDPQGNMIELHRVDQCRCRAANRR